MPKYGRRCAILHALSYRHEYLREIWTQILKDFPRMDWHVQLVVDRPTPSVVQEVARWENCKTPFPHQWDANATWTHEILTAPFSPVEPGQPERFMEFRTWQLRELEKHGEFDYVLVWDDDQLLADPGELRDIIRIGKADRIYGTREYLWGDRKTVRTDIPTHRSLFAWRWIKGDYFPPKRTGQPGPALVHKLPNEVDLQSKLLDFGYILEDHRHRVFTQYKGVGKLDDTTMVLVKPPVLVPKQL